MPLKWNSGGIYFFVLCVCLWQINSNLGHNFWTIRDWDFIFGSILNSWNPLKCHQSQWPCNLDHDLYTKIAIMDFVAAGGIHVSQTHLVKIYVYVNNILYMYNISILVFSFQSAETSVGVLTNGKQLWATDQTYHEHHEWPPLWLSPPGISTIKAQERGW